MNVQCPASHALSAYVDSCHSIPRGKMLSWSDSAISSKPSLTESLKLDGLDHAGVRLDASSGNVTRPATTMSSPSDDVGMPSNFQTSDFTTLVKTLLESNMLLHDEIQEMQMEHRRTMTALTHYWDKSKAPATAPSGAKPHEEEPRSLLPIGQNVFKNNYFTVTSRITADDYLSSSCEDVTGNEMGVKINELAAGCMSTSDEDQVCDVRREGESITEEDSVVDLSNFDEGSNVQAYHSAASSVQSGYSSESDGKPEEEEESEENVRLDAFASPGMLAISKMWDDFSVHDFNMHGRVKSRPKQWTPTITVPKPFSMTIREANSPSRKSKSLERAEREILERNAMEDAALRKTFRATPIPASTFLPLYELINAKNEQKRDNLRKQYAMMLEGTQRPFSFSKRDEVKHTQKKEKAKQIREQEMAKQKENSFKANPVPPKLFDSEAEEKLREQQEYRKIRKKIRADQLLANSKLPPNMQESAAYLNARRKKLKELTKEYCFHPVVHRKIPDYDEVFRRFQEELEAKKRSKCTTVAEGFRLHTDGLSSRRKKKAKEEGLHRAELLSKSSSSPMSCLRKPAYSVQTTQTAQLRQKALKQRQEDLARKESEDEEEWKVKRTQRKKKLQDEVSEKVLRMDQTLWLEEGKKKRKKDFRKRNRENCVKFQQELQNIEERVDARPLLLEQATIPAARSAEFYATALSRSGFSNEEVKCFLQNLQPGSQPEKKIEAQ